MRTRIVDGKVIPLSDEENAQRDQEEIEWSAGEVKRAALKKIAELEASITERRKRDAILSQDGKDWLASVENQIKSERERL